ncbi:Orotidine 5'-phosphate decarboxylase domain-containing protein [Dichotomopilus funicola]|uniref:Orotidine 5'-phosphate decarboxylase n=1 Tax=Dichotomopilus funicola TaxID=1934379 RepID=A0AAN6UXE3_9PEZI|nr:Orotidine 5'-phosphate decarboxylase domain-containing protein [Dichotomopilus funicola]
MASLSKLPFPERAVAHPHPVAKRLFQIAETKKSNLVISADLTDSESLLQCADSLGPYIAVFKTHVDVVADFGDETIQGLKELSKKHNFLIFEDRKLVDIGNTVQKQYHGGVLRLSEWADIVNLSVLGGDGIVEALDQIVTAPSFPFPEQRAFLILAEMTSKGSLATGSYTQKCIDIARKCPRSMIGFVATRALGEAQPDENEDFLVFTTGVNLASQGDKLDQQYQTPASAVERGADFIIASRGIYASANPVEAAKQYQAAGWAAYLKRTRA